MVIRLIVTDYNINYIEVNVKQRYLLLLYVGIKLPTIFYFTILIILFLYSIDLEFLNDCIHFLLFFIFLYRTV